jgi:hypothetical protein
MKGAPLLVVDKHIFPALERGMAIHETYRRHRIEWRQTGEQLVALVTGEAASPLWLPIKGDILDGMASLKSRTRTLIDTAETSSWMLVAAQIDWLDPWEPITNEKERSEIEAEMRREMPQNHLLSQLPLRAIGKRQHRDDRLFILPDKRVAQVHLTWIEEKNPAFPYTEIFEDAEQWAAESMLPEHKGWPEWKSDDGAA